MVEANEFTLTPPSCVWPLIFKYRGPVLGKGFVAVVEFHGRLLARPEGSNEGVWADGVNPGGFAVGAPNIRSMRLELQSTLSGILSDIAEEVDSFDDFKTEVERFFWETDPDTQGQWDAAVKEVQSGRLKSPGLLPVLAAGSPLLVQVTRKPEETVTPKDNSTSAPVLASVA